MFKNVCYTTNVLPAFNDLFGNFFVDFHFDNYTRCISMRINGRGWRWEFFSFKNVGIICHSPTEESHAALAMFNCAPANHIISFN